MKNYKILLLALCLPALAWAQRSEITEEGMKKHLSIIASDAFEGRETGSMGQKLAAQYISQVFSSENLRAVGDSGYYQPFSLYKRTSGSASMSSKHASYDVYEDLVLYGSGSTQGVANMELVVAGKGSEEELDKVDVDGKAVMVFESSRSKWRSIKALAQDKGAKLLLFVITDNTEEFNKMQSMVKYFYSRGQLSMRNPATAELDASVLMMGDHARKLLGWSERKYQKAMKQLEEEGKMDPEAGMALKVEVKSMAEEVRTENVLGFKEGTDLKEEIVVVSSHMDHIGRAGDEIFNGADDDGSGTTMMMTLAEAFAGVETRRSLLFIAFTGEEKGLLGSKFYTDNPVFSLSKTVANFNIDMVGRFDEKYGAESDYVYVVGGNRISDDMHQIQAEVNEMEGLQLVMDYKHNDPNDPLNIYQRSDHYNFAKHGIPVMFYFSGLHPDYHKSTDTVEKIRFDMMKRRADLIYETILKTANRTERPKVNPTESTVKS